eukprot:448981-Alexandrium_andersonii.AAC.1
MRRRAPWAQRAAPPEPRLCQSHHLAAASDASSLALPPQGGALCWSNRWLHARGKWQAANL